MEQEFDMFGHPVDPKTGKPGRPSKRPTPEDRKIIKGMMAEDKPISEMLIVLDMTEPTFRKYFFKELEQKHAWKHRLRAQAMKALQEEALVNRNVAALKELLKRLDAFARQEMERQFLRDQAGEVPSLSDAGPMGKKEAAQMAAREAESHPDWGNDLIFSGRQRSH